MPTLKTFCEILQPDIERQTLLLVDAFSCQIAAAHSLHKCISYVDRRAICTVIAEMSPSGVDPTLTAEIVRIML